MAPQSIWGGLSEEVTTPLPVPALLTVRVKRWALKVAVTDRAAFMVTVQLGPETVSQPLQLAKVEPLAGVALRVTVVPLS